MSAAEPVSVRLFRPDEWSAYRAVRLRALASDPQVFGSNLARERAHGDDHWQGRLAEPECGVFAVLHGTELIGMTGIYVPRATPRIACLWGSWLAPEHRGQGHARAMYAARLAWAQAHPTVQRVQVTHRASNLASMHANQRHGFRFTHRAERDWPDGTREAELCYVLELDTPPTAVTRIWRAADRSTVPWKNGRGTTTELGRAPDGDSLDAFDWRLSTAPLIEDGPFSWFPGVDRVLVLLEGADLRLVVDGVPQVLRVPRDVARFAGEAEVMAHLGAGRVTDLNLMVRRDRFAHASEVVGVTGPTALGTGAPLVAVALSGDVSAGGLPLAPGEAVIADGALTADGSGALLVARLRAVGAAS